MIGRDCCGGDKSKEKEINQRRWRDKEGYGILYGAVCGPHYGSSGSMENPVIEGGGQRRVMRLSLGEGQC